jgi:hypothetical protein
MADGLVDNLDTYIEDSNSIIAKLLDVLQLLNNNHLMSYKTSGIPTHHLYKTASIQFIDANIVNNIKVDTTDTASLVI